MIVVLLQGLLLGLVVSVSAGPSFFALLQIGIQRSFKYGFWMSLGITLSDLTLICVSFFGLATYIDPKKHAGIIGCIGGGVLILFGIYSLLSALKNLKKINSSIQDNIINASSSYSVNNNAGVMTYFFKGYFINLFNPIVLILWAGAVVTVKSMANESSFLHNFLVFFSACVIFMFIFNILKVLLGKKIKDFLKPRIIELINAGVGIIFIVCGIILIIKVLFFM